GIAALKGQRVIRTYVGPIAGAERESASLSGAREERIPLRAAAFQELLNLRKRAFAFVGHRRRELLVLLRLLLFDHPFTRRFLGDGGHRRTDDGRGSQEYERQGVSRHGKPPC